MRLQLSLTRHLYFILLFSRVQATNVPSTCLLRYVSVFHSYAYQDYALLIHPICHNIQPRDEDDRFTNWESWCFSVTLNDDIMKLHNLHNGQGSD
jgi:hypothetical protein